jgi:hypothetical protein
MSILPPATLPWDERFIRSHTPPPGKARLSYRSYRPCLRWEFGFSCAFCLAHETDLGMAAGDTRMETEHFIPVSHDPLLVNQYSNCFYACHFCNHSRRSRSVMSPDGGARLLNPCADLWSDYFVLVDGRLQPKIGGQRDALYTIDVYDLNEDRKVRMRFLRRDSIEGLIEDFKGPWQDCLSVSDALLHEIAHPEDHPGQDPSRRREKLQKARELREKHNRTVRQLLRYDASPWNADRPCVCSPPASTAPRLPAPLARQTLDLGLFFAAAGGGDLSPS